MFQKYTTVDSKCLKKYNFIDLFAGAGGLSEGFYQAGFNPIAHVEMNEYATKTLETRIAYYYFKKTNNLNYYYNYLKGRITREDLLNGVPYDALKTVIHETMSTESIPSIFAKIDTILKEDGVDHVDIIVGGPPCQAYSLVGRAQSSHMLKPMSTDPRNDLYVLYIQFLIKYQPRFFVFENVPGVVSAKGGRIWKSIKQRLSKSGYKIECREQNAKDFGVLQSRKRMIIIGWRRGTHFHYPDFQDQMVNAVVNDALNDLPKLVPGKEGKRYGRTPASAYITNNNIRIKDDVLTLHNARPNTLQDITIYRQAIRLWNENHQRLHYDDLDETLKSHHNRNSFIDRFKVVEGDLPFCHTILAHLSKDGHYFIHPDIAQHRSITPREAARLQSFPDNYYFEGPRTSVFTQIGNAVPPMMAKEIALKLREQLEQEK